MRISCDIPCIVHVAGEKLSSILCSQDLANVVVALDTFKATTKILDATTVILLVIARWRVKSLFFVEFASVQLIPWRRALLSFSAQMWSLMPRP